MADFGISRRRAAALAIGVAALGALERPRAAQAAGDPFAALTGDHRRIAALVARMQKTDENATGDRVRLLDELKRELARHAAVEEYVLYPALRQNADFRRAALELSAEHGDAKTLLYELELTPRSDPRWADKAAALARLLTAHHRREEADVFPKYRASLNSTQLEFLAQLAERERKPA